MSIGNISKYAILIFCYAVVQCSDQETNPYSRRGLTETFIRKNRSRFTLFAKNTCQIFS